MTGAAVGLLLTFALVLSAGTAAAHWKAGGTGSAQAPVATLAAGGQPTLSVSGATVTVQWAQTVFRGSVLGGYGGGGYLVRRYAASGGTAVTPSPGCATRVSGTTTTLSCQETGTPAGSWQYTVTPVLGSWTGAESPKSGSATVASTAPTLTSVTAQDPAAGRSTGDINLVWGSVTGATGYNVYRRTSSGAYDFTAPRNGATPLTQTSYADPGTGLAGGTTYAYVVRAVTSGGESANSNERSATAIARPAAPATVTAAAAAGAKVDVSWASVAAATGYFVYRRTSIGAYDYTTPLSGATAVSGTSYTDTTATNGTSYRYVVRAVGPGAGATPLQSFDSPESAMVTADGVSPGAVSVSDPGSPLRGSVSLTGAATDSGSGVASLRFQYSAGGAATWINACTAVTSPYSCALNTTALTDGLYDLRVIATDAAGNATTSSTVLSRRIDNTAPSVTMGDPGAFLRATVTLTATAGDAGSGVASLRLQRSSTGANAWTDVCTQPSSPASCPLNTTTLPNGGYDLRAIATDAAGNTTTSALVTNRVVDNTAPTGTDIQTTNKTGAIAGKPETGDVVTYSFSEPILPTSVLAGWAGGSTPVTVRFTNGTADVVTVYDSTNGTQLALGSVTSGKKYVGANVNFTGSTMVLSGNTISVTLGTPSGATSTANGATTLQWTTSTAATDRAGNPVSAATVPETGTSDLDF